MLVKSVGRKATHIWTGIILPIFPSFLPSKPLTCKAPGSQAWQAYLWNIWHMTGRSWTVCMAHEMLLIHCLSLEGNYAHGAHHVFMLSIAHLRQICLLKSRWPKDVVNIIKKAAQHVFCQHNTVCFCGMMHIRSLLPLGTLTYMEQIPRRSREPLEMGYQRVEIRYGDKRVLPATPGAFV